jgi:hypothetical protein
MKYAGFCRRERGANEKACRSFDMRTDNLSLRERTLSETRDRLQGALAAGRVARDDRD